MNRKEILNKAESIINGEREGAYGKPEDSFDRIAQLWSVYLNHDISSVDVANMMVLLKVARNAGGVYKDDNWIDICGYAALGGETQSKFDYDGFGQFMNKPVEGTDENILGEAGAAGDPKGDDIPYPVNVMAFDNPVEAAIALNGIKQIIKRYGSCSINEYYYICGESGWRGYMEEKYGWNDLHKLLSGYGIGLSASGKWVLKMPPAVKLDRGENK